MQYVVQLLQLPPCLRIVETNPPSGLHNQAFLLVATVQCIGPVPTNVFQFQFHRNLDKQQHDNVPCPSISSCYFSSQDANAFIAYLTISPYFVNGTRELFHLVIQTSSSILSEDYIYPFENKEGEASLLFPQSTDSSEPNECNIPYLLLSDLIDLYDTNQCNALHLAAQSSTPDAFLFLWAIGCDINAKDKNGSSVRDYAADKPEMLDLIDAILDGSFEQEDEIIWMQNIASTFDAQQTELNKIVELVQQVSKSNPQVFAKECQVATNFTTALPALMAKKPIVSIVGNTSAIEWIENAFDAKVLDNGVVELPTELAHLPLQLQYSAELVPFTNAIILVDSEVSAVKYVGINKNALYLVEDEVYEKVVQQVDFERVLMLNDDESYMPEVVKLFEQLVMSFMTMQIKRALNMLVNICLQLLENRYPIQSETDIDNAEKLVVAKILKSLQQKNAKPANMEKAVNEVLNEQSEKEQWEMMQKFYPSNVKLPQANSNLQLAMQYISKLVELNKSCMVEEYKHKQDPQVTTLLQKLIPITLKYFAVEQAPDIQNLQPIGFLCTYKNENMSEPKLYRAIEDVPFANLVEVFKNRFIRHEYLAPMTSMHHFGGKYYLMFDNFVAFDEFLSLSLPIRMNGALQLFKLLAYLHSLGIAHGNVLPTRIRFDKQSNNLAMFGYANPKQSGPSPATFTRTIYSSLQQPTQVAHQKEDIHGAAIVTMELWLGARLSNRQDSKSVAQTLQNAPAELVQVLSQCIDDNDARPNAHSVVHVLQKITN